MNDSKQQDLYKLLGVAPSASWQAINDAYKAMALVYHPDKAPEEKKEEYTAMFLAIREAVNILTDEQKRRDYDRSRAVGNAGPRSPRPEGRQPPSAEGSAQRPDARRAARSVSEAHDIVPPGPAAMPPYTAEGRVDTPELRRAWSRDKWPGGRVPNAVGLGRPSPSPRGDYVDRGPVSPPPPPSHLGPSPGRPQPDPRMTATPVPRAPAQGPINGPNFLATLRGRYYPNRDSEHLEYNLPSIGIIKKELTKYQIDVLKLMILAHRCRIEVVGFPFMPIILIDGHGGQTLRDRFAFNWQGRPFGEVEVKLGDE